MEQIWQHIQQVIEQQRSGALLTFLGGEGRAKELAGKRVFYSEQTGRFVGDLPQQLQENLAELVHQSPVRAEIVQMEITQGGSDAVKAEVFVQPLLPPPTLLVLGGGHIALPLVELGRMMGFKVTVVDDRPEFANPARFPQADKVICADFAEALRNYHITEQTYIVIVTRGHRYDQMCVEMVIGSNAAYIGMIGSRRKVAAMKLFLQEQGFNPELLDKLHAPIGLNIAAETPAEIALSIMAEVVKTRRLAQENADRKTGELEIDQGVINTLASIEANGSTDQVVLATIVEVKGSAPRKPGAQMLFYRDGRTCGTIGGGCAEAEVRRAAQNVFDKGISLFYTVDLTNDIAAGDGMVCGGLMKVFLAKV